MYKVIYYLNKISSLIFKHKKNLLLNKFAKVGINFSIGKDYDFKNQKYIYIGNNFFAKERFRCEAWDSYMSQKFNPCLQIGNNVIFNTDIHIGCINKVVIGDNCLFGSRIYITDHFHGDTSEDIKNVIPINRPLISPGSVIIENNVFIGEGVVIMPNVTIGMNSIIGANSVVTKSIPKNCVAAGIPARIIKQL